MFNKDKTKFADFEKYIEYVNFKKMELEELLTIYKKNTFLENSPYFLNQIVKKKLSDNSGSESDDDKVKKNKNKKIVSNSDSNSGSDSDSDSKSEEDSDSKSSKSSKSSNSEEEKEDDDDEEEFDFQIYDKSRYSKSKKTFTIYNQGTTFELIISKKPIKKFKIEIIDTGSWIGIGKKKIKIKGVANKNRLKNKSTTWFSQSFIGSVIWVIQI
jgi:hypothetical protein